VKKLKIKGNKIKIIKEESQPSDFKDLMNITGAENIANFGKEIGRTLGAVGIWGVKSLTNIISSTYSTYFKEDKKGDWRIFLSTFLSNQEKNSKYLQNQINKSVENHEKNFQSMLGDIGLSNKEMSVLLAAGSPPLAINNILLDLFKKNKNSTFKEINTTNLIEAIAIIINRYMTNDDDSPLKKVIKGDLPEYIENKFSKNTKLVFQNIDQSKYFDSFIDDLNANPMVKYLDASSQPYELFLSAIKNPSISNNDVVETRKYIKDYLEGDIKSRIKSRNESFIKKINLNSFLIKEISEEKIDLSGAGKILKLAVVISICFCIDQEENIEKYILDNNKGLDEKDIKDIIGVIKNKNDLMKYSMMCLSGFAVYKAYSEAGEEFLRDSKIDLQNKIIEKIKAIFNDYESVIPNSFSDSFNANKRAALKEATALVYDTKLFKEENNLQAIIKFMNSITKGYDENSRKEIKSYIKNINWDQVGKGDYLKSLMENNVLTNEENIFIQKMKRECNIEDEYKRAEAVCKRLQDMLKNLIDSKEEKQSS